MKKSLLALAVLGAFAASAQAQTSVTVYGSFDAGVRHQSNVDNNDSKTTMSSTGTYKSNRIGFKGVEDLGGGLNAHFDLETGFNTGDGAVAGNLFNRAAYVGLGGAWGALDLGHQYSVNFKTIGKYDPFNYNYTGIIPLATQGGLTRLNNDIQYSGEFGPVGVMAEYALGEQTTGTSDGSTYAIGGNYSGGPFTVGAAYTNRNNTAGTADQKNWTVGGAYATGPFRVALGYADSKYEAGYGFKPVANDANGASPVAIATEVTIKDAWVGGSYAMSPAATLSAAYYQTKGSSAGLDGKRKMFIVGGTYALSKRTNFYADIDSRRYDGAAGQVLSSNGNNETQTGISVGINHLF